MFGIGTSGFSYTTLLLWTFFPFVLQNAFDFTRFFLSIPHPSYLSCRFYYSHKSFCTCVLQLRHKPPSAHLWLGLLIIQLNYLCYEVLIVVFQCYKLLVRFCWFYWSNVLIIPFFKANSMLSLLLIFGCKRPRLTVLASTERECLSIQYRQIFIPN